MRGRRGSARWIVYTVVVTLGLLVGWELFAHHYDVAQKGLLSEGGILVDGDRSLSLENTLGELRALDAAEPTTAPSILVLGSSQIAVVKRSPSGSHAATPYRLHAALVDAGVDNRVLDFSAGGQQVLESAVIYVRTLETIDPRVVVLGVGLFSMGNQELRPGLAKDVDLPAARELLEQHLPPSVPDAVLAELSRVMPASAGGTSDRSMSVQQRIDHRISTWLESHSDAIGKRTMLFNRLIDRPIRLDLITAIRKTMKGGTGVQTSRTFEIGNGYPVALAAIEGMAGVCRDHRTQLLVVILPFAKRDPVPYTPETQARVAADLGELASRDGFELLDLGDLLGNEHFVKFLDGSLDNLHYDGPGHDQVGRAIAKKVAAMLQPSDGVRKASNAVQ